MGGRHLVVAAAMLAGLSAGRPALADCKLSKFGELPVTMLGVQPVVSLKINGKDARLVADSGAFFSILTPAAAEKFGMKIRPAPAQLTVRGVNGDAKVSMVKADDFTLIGVTLHGTDFLVSATGGEGGRIDGYLGQNVLGAVDVEYDFANGVMRLFKADGCANANLAYWSKSGVSMEPTLHNPGPSRHVSATALVNGKKMMVTFDTGAGYSILTRKAALRAGIKLDGPGVVSAGMAGGFGRKSVETWVAPVDSFELGGEQIKNTRLRVGGIELGDADMLIGADFFLSHRIYVANGLNKIFFTYNGGPVFKLDRAHDDDEPPTRAAPSVPATPVAEAPTDAAGLSRRAAALMARRDFAQAIEDLTRAIELEPKNARYLLDRAGARLGNRQPLLAMSDIEGALRLDPELTPALMLRAALRLASNDEAGARSDFEAAARLDPHLRLDIASAYAGSRRYETAIGLLDQWIVAYPKDDRMAFALNERCWARALLGRELDKALADCDAALKQRPHTAGFLDSRGLVLVRLGRYDEAIDDYDEALKLRPRTAWSHYGRGLAKLRKGQQAEGRTDLATAAELDPALARTAARFGLAAEPAPQGQASK